MPVSTEFENLVGKFDKHKNNSYYINSLYIKYLPIKELLKMTKCEEYRDVERQLNGCGTWFAVETINGKNHVTESNFCRRRTCPMCQFRRSEKMFLEMMKTCENLKKQGFEFLHVTLTIPNVSTASELVEAVDQLNTNSTKLFRFKRYVSFDKDNNPNAIFGVREYKRLDQSEQKLCKLVDISKSWLGEQRAIEVTYNYKTKTFHPHLHILVAVRKSYFTNHLRYISQNLLQYLWGHLNNVSRPSVWVRKVNDDFKGVAEVCKYAMKPLQAIASTQNGSRAQEERDKDNWQLVKALAFDLKGARLLARFGVIAESYNAVIKNADKEPLGTPSAITQFYFNERKQKYEQPNKSSKISNT